MSDDESIIEYMCWFCRKGRHDDCMVNIPISTMEHDCSFSVEHRKCVCIHKEKEKVDKKKEEC